MADSVMLVAIASDLLTGYNRRHLVVLSLSWRSLVVVLLGSSGMHAVVSIVNRASSHRWLRGHQVGRVMALANQVAVRRSILMVLLKLMIEAALTSRVVINS